MAGFVTDLEMAKFGESFWEDLNHPAFWRVMMLSHHQMVYGCLWNDMIWDFDPCVHFHYVCKVNWWVPYKLVALGQGGILCRGIDFEPKWFTKSKIWSMRPETTEPEMWLVRLLEDDPNSREHKLPYSQRFFRETWQRTSPHYDSLWPKILSKQQLFM